MFFFAFSAFWIVVFSVSEPYSRRCRGVTSRRTIKVTGELVTMKRKPDLVMALVLAFGIGVVVTGYAQALVGS